nr:HAD family hydrolase [Akkermansiaceae bacterium]
APAAVERGAPGLDRLLRVYLSVVLAVGVITLLVWWLRMGEPWRGVQAMISVFVVSCPCALGVAIPLADDLAASAMQRLGVYVRTATLWPRLRRVRKVVFDKTGTLTLDRPVLENPGEVVRLDDPAALALAQLTRGSLHPVARALLEALGIRGQRLLAQAETTDPEELPGLGVFMDTPDGRWSLGRIGWDGRALEAPDASGAGSELRHDGRVVAVFRFVEALRPGAAETLADLKQAGLSLHILSGDHPDKVAHMAATLEIPPTQAHGGLSPEEKSRRVRALDAGDLLYLGDGANDSLAFDAALVTGTPVVDRSLLESKADFFVLGSGLGFLPGLLTATRARAVAVRAAFAFALVYNIVAVAFCAAGRMLPAVAAIIMPISSILSIFIVVGLSGAINAKKFRNFS